MVILKSHIMSKSKATLFEMCAVLEMILLHKKQEVFQEITQCLRLLTDCKVARVTDSQNEIRLTGDTSKDFHEKSCWMT